MEKTAGEKIAGAWVDRWESASPEQTLAWGKLLSRLLRPGDLLCLYGELGAGKTLLAQGIGRAWGVTDPITSPTFTMIQEYRDQGFVHMDLYRLRRAEEAEGIGVWDFLQADQLVVIEWPEILEEALPAERIEVRLNGSGDQARRIELRLYGGTEERAEAWQKLKDMRNSS